MGSRFEDLLVWSKARELTRHIYRITGCSPFSRDFDLRGQIRKASVSTMSNIAEGHERGSDAEFARFLTIARGSCGEVRSQLYVALDQSYIEIPAFEELTGLSIEVSRMTRALSDRVRSRVQR